MTHTAHTPTAVNTVLHIDASARLNGSISRQLAEEFLNTLHATQTDLSVIQRPVTEGIPHINNDWIGANFTPGDDRSPEQNNTLALSDQLIEEINGADVLLFNIPVYNFSIPSALKAWIDHVCRAGITFNYTENGPKGLLGGKRAVLIFASGGTAIGSDIDFASGYMRHALGFIGITDVTIIAADRLMAEQDRAMAAAREGIQKALADIG